MSMRQRPRPSLRPAARLAVACAWALVASPAAGQATEQRPPSREDAAQRRARALLREVGLVDTHNDLPWVLRLDPAHPMDLEARDLRVRGPGDTDIPRLRDGGVGTQFWSVYVPSTLPPLEATRVQLEQVDLARRLIARYPRDLGFAASTADIRRVRASGRIASLLGIEGGHVIANSLGALRAFHELGVRYMTLTHFDATDWADAATAAPRHGGLTPFGREVVREMNRLGMMVDISHVSPDAMGQVLDVTEAPVIFSHSSARALTDHPRNVPDAILRRLARNGGVVQVNFVTFFVSEPLRRWAEGLLPQLQAATDDTAAARLVRDWTASHGPMPRATVADLADHVEHIRRVAGADHVGIGADFYGATGPMNVVVGMEDVSRYPALFAELIRRGWSDADLRKLAGGNLLRVFAEVERVSARLRRTRPPSTATIEALDGRPSAAPPADAALAPLPPGVEAISLLGDTLRAPTPSPAARARLEGDLARARTALVAAPDDPDAHLWFGRRLAYLGRYREAIAAFTAGAVRFPADARFLRHRGHRYLTIRRFDLAIADLARARDLVRGQPDQVEPDGAPNARNIPTSTLQTNIWYHLGLAHFLRGEFGPALAAFDSGSAISANPDMRVSMDYWRYLCLARLGRRDEAARLAAGVRDGLEIIENDAYYGLLRLYAGRIPADSVLPSARLAEVTPSDAAAAYGVSQHWLLGGRAAEAQALWRRMVAGGPWAAFGVLAAEAELARGR